MKSIDPCSTPEPLSETAFLKLLEPSAEDSILICLAFSALRTGGHRHGDFIEAAVTAAKCAVYLTYLEHNQNLRLTGTLHHIEPKRVKSIVKEVESAIQSETLLKMLGSHEPHYLLQLPYLWLERFPWHSGESRLSGTSLTPSEIEHIVSQCPEILPDAKLINQFQLMDMIEALHNRYQAELPDEQRSPLSEARADHIRYRLLHSGTILKLDSGRGLPFYAPSGEDERQFTVVEDTARYLQLMRNWARQTPAMPKLVLRAVEDLRVAPEHIPQALSELDQLIRDWADRYHDPQGIGFALNLAAGQYGE